MKRDHCPDIVEDLARDFIIVYVLLSILIQQVNVTLLVQVYYFFYDINKGDNVYFRDQGTMNHLNVTT